MKLLEGILYKILVAEPVARIASNACYHTCIPMTSLLMQTVARSTRTSFKPKTINQPLKKFLNLAVS